MGLFDLPAPLFTWITSQLSDYLPPVTLIVLWALVGAVIATELYRLLSPQHRLAAVKAELRAAQRDLSGYDGELAGAWPRMGRLLRLALQRIALILPAAILSSLPLLSLIVWLDTAYSRSFPDSAEPAAPTIAAPGFGAQWRDTTEKLPRRLVVTDEAGKVVADVVVRAPVDRIEKRHWWNLLFGNPAGYLPAETPVDRIDLPVERREMIAVGPPWLRGWEAMFFVPLLVGALTLNLLRRVE
jgi:hypothetical protein